MGPRNRCANRLGGFAKSEIDHMPTQGRVIVFLEWHDPVITQSGRSAPDHHIAVRERYPRRGRSERFNPPKRKTAGMARETETMGASKTS